MFIWFIIAAILAVVAAAFGVFFFVARKKDKVRIDEWNEENKRRISDGFTSARKSDVPRGGLFLLAAGVLAALAGLFLILSTTFAVDNGSAAVLKDWSGVVAEDPITEPGFHTKAPWQDAIIWDIKNQDIQFKGKDLVFIDKDGISAPMELQVLFSIRADSIVELTKNYSSQEDFKLKVVANDSLTVPRDVASTFTTVEVFEERTRLKSEIQSLFEETWADKGIIINNVNIHGTPYPEDVQQRFKDAQNAQTELLKAETDAKTLTTKAQGEADANKILADSLTPQVLQQRWIDAITSANTIIVPQDFTSLGNLAPQQ